MRYFALLLLLGYSLAVSAQNDRSLSPYFQINVDSGASVPDFPLQQTSAAVEIAGVIADVTITQVYINRSQRPIEAVYIFPGSTNAAVYAMEMQIGRRVITAEIREKQEARDEYENAKADGKTASLLEQQRPNIFTMNVANIMPGDSIIVRMSYTERLIPTQGEYEFVYPTVVAPRYVGAGAGDFNAQLKAGPGNSNEGVPYSPKGVESGYDFNIDVKISSAIPFESVQSPTHKVLLSFKEKNTATVLLDPAENKKGDRDFVLKYRFAGGKIETGLMLYEGKEENFFMLMMQPPKTVPLDSIPPREYIFVMDVSGSMSGFPLETAKKLLVNLVSGLRPSDKFNVVQFAGGAALFSPVSVNATKENVDSALIFLNKPTGGGGTELNFAMMKAMAVPYTPGYSRTIAIVTDGEIAAEAQVYKSMRGNLDSANVFAFGIGSSCNRYVIEGMAFSGSGEPFVVLNSSDADSTAAKFRRYISSPVLTDISVLYPGFDVYDVEPLAVPDLFAERPLIITGKYRGKATGKIVVDGMTGAGAYHKEIRVDSVKAKKQNKPIRLLWARDRVKYLSYLDEPGGYYGSSDTSAKTRILALGLEYGILTNYTSFVAVDRRERNKEGIPDSTIQQVLPLPAGQENNSIGVIGVVPTLSGVVNISSGNTTIIHQDRAMVMSCDRPSIASVVLVPVFRPEAPHSTLVSQDPVTARDINWNNNGGYQNPVFRNEHHSYFSPGASGRIIGELPVNMISRYTALPISDGADILVPYNSAAVTLSPGGYTSKQLILSGTQKGNQSLFFAYDLKSKNEKWRALFEIGEQWNPLRRDANADGYPDFRTGMSTTLHSRVNYSNSINPGARISFASIDFLVHGSSWSARTTRGQYATADEAQGIYVSPDFTFKLTPYAVLRVTTNFGYASLYNEFGINRFHLNTSTAGLNVTYQLIKGSSTFRTGAKANSTMGEERWNAITLDQNYNGGSLFAHYSLRRDKFTLYSGLRYEYDEVNKDVLLPYLRLLWREDKIAFNAQASYYRGAPFSMGQLLPLLNSSRTLSVFLFPGTDEGWFAQANVNFYPQNKYWLSLSYGVIVPKTLLMVNTDEWDNQISVYTGWFTRPMHRISAATELELPWRFVLKGNYLATWYVLDYNQTNSISPDYRQMPLLPKHRAMVSLRWRSQDSRFRATAEWCYTGAQRLPQHGWSPDYSTANALLSYDCTDRISVFLNGFNLFNYRQETIIMQTGTPDQFDGWMQWAPLTGTSIQGGVSIKFR